MLEHCRHRGGSTPVEQRRYSDLAAPREAAPALGKDPAGLLCGQLAFALPPSKSAHGHLSPCRNPLKVLNH